VEGTGGHFERFISFPSSPYRIAWDLIGALLIGYDLFAIPLQVFNPPQTLFIDVMDWFTLVFWTINIPLSFFVGFVKAGITVMSFDRIAFNYVKTWLLTDLLVVVPDWVFSFIALASGEGASSDAESSMRLLRALKLLRMVRLLRLLKLRKILQNINELIDTEYASIFANILKMILLLLVINHYIGCAWFWVSNSVKAKNRWIEEYQFDVVHWSYQYITAFHWSLTQFTPSSMHVQPQNFTERVFAIAVVVFALVGFSYVVGSITGSLTQLRSMQEDTYKQFWNLRRYLKQHRVPMVLSARIQRYLEHAWSSQKQSMTVTGTKLFSLLSEQLHSELQCEVHLPHLRVHPLFCELSVTSSTTMRRLANSALRTKLMARSDSLFIAGETGTHMYIVASGQLDYHRFTEHGDRRERVDRGEDWISEPVLWTPTWVHLGGLTAITECNLLLVEPEKFSHVINRSPPAVGLTITYARNFMRWLNARAQDELSDVWQGQHVAATAREFMGNWPKKKSQLSQKWKDRNEDQANGSSKGSPRRTQ